MRALRWYASSLQELSEEECYELLAARPVGRVAYAVATGPVVLPVNYVLDGRDILFRTSPYTELGREMLRGRVAFEVDDIDAFRESGWSVLVRGDAAYDDSDVLRPLDSPGPWAAGSRHLMVRITPRLVTGRRLIPS